MASSSFAMYVAVESMSWTFFTEPDLLTLRRPPPADLNTHPPPFPPPAGRRSPFFSSPPFPLPTLHEVSRKFGTFWPKSRFFPWKISRQQRPKSEKTRFTHFHLANTTFPL